MVAAEYDYILVGGGLQNGLIALGLRNARPNARIAIVEREPRLGGNHTWCFHQDDVEQSALDWIEPLVCHRWPAYKVQFPGLERTIDGGYFAITSERFDDVVRGSMENAEGSRVLLETDVVRVDRSEIELDGGDVLTARIVIDARGPSRDPDIVKTSGFQKFVGLEVKLSAPHGRELPILMDATVDQRHGFRFFYTLPLGADRLLIEDTYFHHSPVLDVNAIRDEILRYADANGYGIASIEREETGVLPMPWTGSLPSSGRRPIVAGYSGGWFHPATGYSLPVAARVADHIAATPIEELERRGLDELVGPQISQSRYCHLLNRFLFRWYPPESRWHIFARFYRLPLGTIERFYALRMRFFDKFRLLVGKPPRGLSVAFRFRRGG